MATSDQQQQFNPLEMALISAIRSQPQGQDQQEPKQNQQSTIAELLKKALLAQQAQRQGTGGQGNGLPGGFNMSAQTQQQAGQGLGQLLPLIMGMFGGGAGAASGAGGAGAMAGMMAA